MEGVDPALYRACLHGAAHTAVAHRLGYPGTHFRVWQTALPENGPYTGRTYVFEDVWPEDARLISLAGAVAELLMDDGAVTADWVHARLVTDGYTLSPSDAAGAEGFSWEDVRRTLWFVQATWPDIEAAVDSVLREIGARP